MVPSTKGQPATHIFVAHQPTDDPPLDYSSFLAEGALGPFLLSRNSWS